MKHTKSGREKRAIREMAHALCTQVQVGILGEEAERKAEYMLKPYIACGIREQEFEGIAKRVAGIWVLSAESLASKQERLYGKARPQELLRESSQALLSVALVSMFAEKPKEAAERLLAQLESLHPSIHWEFILLNAMASGESEGAVAGDENVQRALARAFSEDRRLAALLEGYIEKKADGDSE